MSATPILHQLNTLESALADALRQQGAEIDEHHGHVVAFVDFDVAQVMDRPRIDVSRLARDVERALS